MKQGDGQKMNLSFTVQPSNWKFLALFRNSNSSGMHDLASLIYNPPTRMTHHRKKGYQVSLRSINLVGRQRHASCTKVRYKWEGKSASQIKWSTATSGVQGGWGIYVPGGIQNLTGQGPEQLDLTSQLGPASKLIWAGAGPEDLQSLPSLHPPSESLYDFHEFCIFQIETPLMNAQTITQQ